MEEIFNKYTAGELLEFLDEKNITKYIEQRTVDVDEEGEVIITINRYITSNEQAQFTRDLTLQGSYLI